MKKRTVIIGGGLSGLACATQLEKQNHDYIIIEKSSRLGGRVGSVYEDGYIFDIGFFWEYSTRINYLAFEYLEIATNIRDFAILSKLSPWDHIPGILIVREAGGFDIHFDKTPYAHNIKKKNLVVSGSITLQNEIINLIKE